MRICYQFRIVTDIGDTYKWWSEYHVESSLYATAELASKALSEYKKRLIQEARKTVQEYIDSQYQFEVRNNTVNEFLGYCQRRLIAIYKDVLDIIRTAEIIAVNVYCELQDDVKSFDIAH